MTSAANEYRQMAAHARRRAEQALWGEDGDRARKWIQAAAAAERAAADAEREALELQGVGDIWRWLRDRLRGIYD